MRNWKFSQFPHALGKALHNSLERVEKKGYHLSLLAFLEDTEK